MWAFAGQIDAAIVRVMKARRQMNHNNLLIEVINDGMPNTRRHDEDLAGAIVAVKKLLMQTPRRDDRLEVFTDGGAEGQLIQEERASWCVATDAGRVFGKVMGADRSSAASERWAAYICMAAIKISGSKERHMVIIDNISVCDQIKKIVRHGWKQPQQCFGMWKDIFDAMQGNAGSLGRSPLGPFAWQIDGHMETTALSC